MVRLQITRNPWLLAAIGVGSVGGAFLIAPAAGVLLGIVWFLFPAARYDNHTGSCLMIAALFVTVLATLAFLIGLTALPLRP